MTISLRGSATGLAAGTTTSLSFTLPTGNTTNDLLIAAAAWRAYTATLISGTLTSNYTFQSGGANGTTANGLDAGSTYAAMYTRVHSGTESAPTGTLSASPSPRMSGMLALQSSNSGSGWSLAATEAEDTTSGTAGSWVGGTLGFAVGDWLVILVAHNSDSKTHTSPAISASGITFSSLTQRLSTTTTTSGNDGSMYLYTCEVTAGSGTVAPTFSTSNNLDGQAVFLRVREPAPPTNYNGGGSASVTVSLSSAGNVATFGNASVSPTVSLSADGAASSGPTDDYALFWQDNGLLLLSDSVGVQSSSTPWLADELFLQRSVGVTGTASDTAVSVTTTAAGVVGKVGDASQTTGTVTTTAAATVGKVGSASTLAETVTTSAAGVVNRIGSASTVAATVTTTAAGVVARFGSASTVSETVTLTAAATVGKIGNASTVAETVAVTAAGVAAANGTASDTTATVSLTASGFVSSGLSGGASLTGTVTVVTDGSVAAVGSASLATTVGVTASGLASLSSDATQAVSVSVTAAGSISYSSDAGEVTAVFAATAAGVVVGWRIVSPTYEQVYTDVLPASRYGIDTAKTIILKDGVVTVEDYPDQLTLEQADAYYMGGREHNITQAEYDAIVAAGRPDLVEIV